MIYQSVLITGGAGFVGSSLAIKLREASPGTAVAAFDNLHRRGSELNLPRLREAGIPFLHGDARCPEDLQPLPDFDLLIDCAAEPSVQAGTRGTPQYVLNNNLAGTINCLESARSRGAAFLLLSSSRVYPIPAVNAIPFHEDATRFRWDAAPPCAGFSSAGIAESFSLDGPRSFYGASKLAAEVVLQEYVHAAGMKALVNRCGILAGPWQMGKVDQGVITLWVARHYFQKPLQYIGFGGLGKQVRDLLHLDDLFDLIMAQMQSPMKWNGSVYNIGGGVDTSVSLMELTALCESITGRRIPITPVPETNACDLRIFMTDARKAQRDFQWRPRRGAAQIVRDIYCWIDAHRDAVGPILE